MNDFVGGFLAQPALIGPIGGPELLLIFVIVLLLFGAKRLPELAKGMGRSIREFKKATSDVETDLRSAMDAADPSKPSSSSQASKPTPVPPTATGETIGHTGDARDGAARDASRDQA